MYDEQEEGKWIPLSQGKGGANFWGEGVEHKGGGGSAVKGGNPVVQDWAKAHGLKDKIHPLQADPIISIKEVQAN